MVARATRPATTARRPSTRAKSSYLIDELWILESEDPSPSSAGIERSRRPMNSETL